MAKKETYELRFKECASTDEQNAILEGINLESMEAKEMAKIVPFAFLIKDSEGKVLAGVTGHTLYGCLEIDSLWVSPDHRKREWGTQLLHEAEKLGKKRGCTFASVSTMDWEAHPFYEKLGYKVEFVREGFDKDSKMYILRKPLA
ncbi:MAG: GNAT family N-acetyltransferase [Chlamydiales bacterium]|nr:GNAT family N-acetyltransferase [Chlamydiales bacterium]